MFTVAIQYPSFGVQHPPRLRAIAEAAPRPDARVVAMEMFRKDSDYEWAPVSLEDEPFERYTVMDCESAEGRRSPRLREEVVGALEEIAPDVLVVNGWGHVESRISLSWSRSRRCVTVLLSDSVYENVPRSWWKELYKRWVVRNCRSAFVAGTPQARYAERLGIPRDRIFHPGSCVVDNDCWRTHAERARENAGALRESLGLPENYFLSVARFIEFKNIPFLVRAYARYREEAGGSYFGLVLLGSGPEEQRIREAVRASGAPEVHIPGFLQADVLPTYYGLASCFVMPSSHFEPWGLVVNEAMASGLPVLVSDQCGCAEDLVCDGANGWTFDPRDESGLARLMAAVADSADRRSAMARESQRIIEGHSCEVGAANLWKAVEAARC